MILSRNFPSVVFTFFVNRETRQNWKKKIMRVNFFEIESLTHPIDMNWLLSVILFNYQFRQLLVICVIKRTILEWISYSKSNWIYPKWSHEVLLNIYFGLEFYLIQQMLCFWYSSLLLHSFVWLYTRFFMMGRFLILQQIAPSCCY